MNIVFETWKIEKIFNSERELYRTYGKEIGRVIMRRMAFLHATECLAQVPAIKPTRRHQLSGARAGQFAVDLKQPYRLVFVPNHDPVPQKEDGGIDLTQVTAIRILTVEDYH